jgi:23S rRNA pseudouridine1911/1915/1917 synthase
MVFPSEEPIEPRVVYEDEWLVAVDKPARMHSAPGLGSGDLCAWVFERYPEARDLGLDAREAGTSAASPSRDLARGEGGLLHRLDYETSGIVLFARKASAFASLIEQQERGAFCKEYLAFSSLSREARPSGSVPLKGIPRGVVPEDWAEAREADDLRRLSSLLASAIEAGGCGIEAAFRPYGPKGARVACLGMADAAKPYLSDMLGCSPSAGLRGGEKGGIELRVGISRGFRHQIRAHLAWIGLPIIGDPLYGGAADERLRLYAVRLAFAHPVTGRPLSLSSEDIR